MIAYNSIIILLEVQACYGGNELPIDSELVTDAAGDSLPQTSLIVDVHL